jgi:hypothetical protein
VRASANDMACVVRGAETAAHARWDCMCRQASLCIRRRQALHPRHVVASVTRARAARAPQEDCNATRTTHAHCHPQHAHTHTHLTPTPSRQHSRQVLISDLHPLLLQCRARSSCSRQTTPTDASRCLSIATPACRRAMWSRRPSSCA